MRKRQVRTADRATLASTLQMVTACPKSSLGPPLNLFPILLRRKVSTNVPLQQQEKFDLLPQRRHPLAPLRVPDLVHGQHNGDPLHLHLTVAISSKKRAQLRKNTFEGSVADRKGGCVSRPVCVHVCVCVPS